MAPSTRALRRFLPLLLLLGGSPAVHAQSLLGRVRAAARRTVEHAVDGGADRVLGAATADSATPAPSGSSDTAPAPGAAVSTAGATQAAAPAGDVLFATTFASDAVGSFPAGFTLGSGTYEVADVRGRRVLRATAFGQLHVELPADLPERFTLEFEMAAPMGWVQDVRFAADAPMLVRLAPNEGGLAGRGMNAMANPASNPGGGRFFPVRVVADGAAVRVYHSGTLVANVPEAEVGRSNRLTFSFSASQQYPVLLAGVRLTSGSTGAPTSGNPNYPGPTPGTTPGAETGPQQPQHNGRFDAEGVGAVDMMFSGPAEYVRLQTGYALTFRGEDGQHQMRILLSDLPSSSRTYAVGGTPTLSATVLAPAGTNTREFRALRGWLAVTSVHAGRLEGRFDFETESTIGEGVQFTGGFDARQVVAVPELAGSLAQRTVTTALADARWAFEDPYHERFDAVTGNPYGRLFPRRSMLELQRTPGGGFVMQPGYYAYQAESFSLNVGAFAPADGQGYLFAPIAGPAEDVVRTLLRNGVQHPEVAQADIQRLIWALTLRMSPADFPASLRAAASRLLTPYQLTRWQAEVSAATATAYSGTAGGQLVAASEAMALDLLRRDAPLAEIERVALLGAPTGTGSGSRPLTRAQWSFHPDGYWVRYLPVSYSRTDVEILVLQGSPTVGKEFDPATHVAVPGNTAGQRLLMSGRLDYSQH